MKTDTQIIKVTVDPDGDTKEIECVPADFARQMERERDEAREAYTAETQSTMDMTKRIIELEGCLRTEGMRIENLKADRDHWRNKHSELFMKVNPIQAEGEECEECEECEGTGQRAFAVNCPEYTPCVDCNGTGRILDSLHNR